MSVLLDRPRLAVYRSNARILYQIIDDVAGLTLASAHDMEAKKGTKIEHAQSVGTEIAKKAQRAAGIKTVVFDRGGFIYTGRVEHSLMQLVIGGLIF